MKQIKLLVFPLKYTFDVFTAHCSHSKVHLVLIISPVCDMSGCQCKHTLVFGRSIHPAAVFVSLMCCNKAVVFGGELVLDVWNSSGGSLGVHCSFVYVLRERIHTAKLC